jgi:von Willebrand factor type A domain
VFQSCCALRSRGVAGSNQQLTQCVFSDWGYASRMTSRIEHSVARSLCWVLAPLSALGCMVACGTSPDGFSDGQVPDPVDTGSPGSSSGACGLAGCSDPPKEDPKPVFKDCAKSTSAGRLRPLHVILSVDISGSMCWPGDTEDPTAIGCDYRSKNGSSKWGRAVSALGSFFESTQSDGLLVSLVPWSYESDSQCSGSFDKSILGAAPVAMPSPKVRAEMQKLRPSGGTPTAAAIDGAVRLAKLSDSKLDGTKTAVALLTDGVPTACPGDGTLGSKDEAFVGAEAAARRAKTANVPIYVIGVGSELQSLNRLADLGGTTRATLISSNASFSQKLVEALAEIRGKALECILDVPKAPAGETLDYNLVNVRLGGASPLPYSPGCSNLEGWRYDVDPKAGTPTKIELCTSACTKVKAQSETSIETVLGCQSVIK